MPPRSAQRRARVCRRRIEKLGSLRSRRICGSLHLGNGCLPEKSQRSWRQPRLSTGCHEQFFFWKSHASLLHFTCRTTETPTSKKPLKSRRKGSRPKRGRNLQTDPKPPDQTRHFSTLAREPPRKTKSLEDSKLEQGTRSTSFGVKSYLCLKHLTGGRGGAPTSLQSVARNGAQRRRGERQAGTCGKTTLKKIPDRLPNFSTPARHPEAKGSEDTEKPATQALHFHHTACTDRFLFYVRWPTRDGSTRRVQGDTRMVVQGISYDCLQQI